MSDGMTDAYRAGRAYDRFQELINEATAEYTLLVDETKEIPTAKYELQERTSRIKKQLKAKESL